MFDLGSYDLTYLAKNQESPIPTGPSDCLSRSSGTEWAFQVDGLSITELQTLLAQKECNTTSRAFQQPAHEPQIRMFLRLLEAYVLARFPVILYVNANVFWDKIADVQHDDAERRSSIEQYFDAHPVPSDAQVRDGHAVVVVGLRWSAILPPKDDTAVQGRVQPERDSPAPDALHNSHEAHGSTFVDSSVSPPTPPKAIPSFLPTVSELIVHDPGKGPFLKRSTDHSVLASEWFDPREPRAVRAVFVVHASISLHAEDCCCGLHESAYDDHDREVWKQCFDGHPGWEYRVHFVHSDDVHEAIFEPGVDRLTRLDREKKQNAKSVPSTLRIMEAVAGNLRRGWHWAIAAYHIGRLSTVWLFDASPDQSIHNRLQRVSVPWELRFRSIGGTWVVDPPPSRQLCMRRSNCSRRH